MTLTKSQVAHILLERWVRSMDDHLGWLDIKELVDDTKRHLRDDIDEKQWFSPHRCPVCEGNSLVPAGFYSQTSGEWSSAGSVSEQCRSCDGKGYIIVEGGVKVVESRRDKRL